MVRYINNEQIVIEIKKLMLDKGITQKQVADRLGITPQGLNKLFTKKNFGFEDAKKILDVMGYTLVIDFEKNAEQSEY